jgi:hypothetical protein
MRRNFLKGPYIGGCAAVTNEGDFIPIATALGAELGNMNYAWSAPIPLERTLAGDPEVSGVFILAGDSLIAVNKYGARTLNEKAPYNELAQEMLQWDGRLAEYPDLLMFPIWDRRSAHLFAGVEYGGLIPPEGTEDPAVVSAATLEELASRLDERLARVADRTGGARLQNGFVDELRRTIAEFNEAARAGVDSRLHRGETPIELTFNGPAREGNDANPTMYPISGSGPYYATIIAPGTLDTKGGPVTNPNGQVLDYAGDPIPGLYGVGNCVASPSAQGYWAGGATLGPIVTFAYLAAHSAVKEPNRARRDRVSAESQPN